MFRRLFVVLVVVAASLIAGPARADARPAHQCARHVDPPIAGYMVRDTAHTWPGLRYFASDSLTQGLFAGFGGTYVIVKECK